jgi:Mg-chelatase subunit ChlD
MADLTKPTEPSHSLVGGKLTSKSSSFKSRIEAQKKQSEAVDPQTMPNRICLMLDCSGSMDTVEAKGQRRIDLLKDAVQNFVTRCSFADTSIAIATFPGRTDKALPLTTQGSVVINYSMGLEPVGGTPLHDCVTRCVTEVPMTRGVIVSDGGATDWRESGQVDEPYGYEEAGTRSLIAKSVLSIYKDQHISLDCVHISSGTDGEELLRRIARETGGIFMKFSDVNAFSKAFGYLTPSYRALLTGGSVTAQELGAKEIK